MSDEDMWNDDPAIVRRAERVLCKNKYGDNVCILYKGHYGMHQSNHGAKSWFNSDMPEGS